MPLNPSSKPSSRTSTPSLQILSPSSSTTDYTSCAALSSANTSSYRSFNHKNKKKQLSQEAIRTIIKNAFREFRGIHLTDSKLQECEENVCHDNYMLCPKEAALRIFEIVDNMDDSKLIETTLTISNQSSFELIMNRRRSLAQEKSIVMSEKKYKKLFDNSFQLDL